MGYPKDEHNGRLTLLVQMPIPMGIRMTTTVKINMGGDETTRRWCLAAQRATPVPWSAITQEKTIEKSAQLSWLARIRFVCQIRWPDGRPGELVHNTLLEGHKTGCLQET